MNHIIKTQPHHLDACSQFAIAMATGMDVETVLKDMGLGGKSTPAIIEYLVRIGFSNGDSGKHGERVNLQGRGVLIIQSAKEGHAVAYERGVIYDPNGKIFKNSQDLLRYYMDTDENKLRWSPRAVIEVAPVITREFAVGGGKKVAK